MFTVKNGILDEIGGKTMFLVGVLHPVELRVGGPRPAAEIRRLDSNFTGNPTDFITKIRFADFRRAQNHALLWVFFNPGIAGRSVRRAILKAARSGIVPEICPAFPPPLRGPKGRNVNSSRGAET